MKKFSAKIEIIGINPFVHLSKPVLNFIFKQADKDKGPIPVRGKLNGHPFKQTLVKYKGHWRLYLNTPMRENAGIDVGDMAKVEIEFDPTPRTVPVFKPLVLALIKDKRAQLAFEKLAPSHQKEIYRYFNQLKSAETRTKNIEKIIRHLLGQQTEGLYALMQRKKT